MSFVYLAAAILCEVGATLSLRMAVHHHPRFYGAVTIGYLSAFALLSLALAEGLALGVAYGIWAAAGVALTAIASRLLFEEPFNRVMAGGITLIIGGVMLVELGAH